MPISQTKGRKLAFTDKTHPHLAHVKNHEGYFGAFTKDEIPGMYPNGTVIEKVNSSGNDRNQDGARGVILGSMRLERGDGYFIAWDTAPNHAVFVQAERVRKL